MLKEVRRLCNNDFSNITDRYEVVANVFAGGQEVLATGLKKNQAEILKELNEIENSCMYTDFEIRRIN